MIQHHPQVHQKQLTHPLSRFSLPPKQERRKQNQTSGTRT